MSFPTLLFVLDLLGTLVFALNGALTAIKVAKLDLIGVLTLGTITAIGGGLMRDVLLGATPPAALEAWPYLTVAFLGGAIAFQVGHHLHRFRVPILVLDAAGLSLFAVTGTAKALSFGLGALPAICLGVLTAVGGGTVRDVMVRQIPTILHSELYVVPAVAAGVVVVLASSFDWPQIPAALCAAALCFGIRGLGLRYRLNVPRVGSPPNRAPR